MRYYLVAGEPSGDLHASNLIKALSELNPDAQFRGWGGDLMAAAGMDLVKHYRDLAFMGFLEVVRHLPEILRNLKSCKADILAFRPDVLILIDYPGFNLRMASWAKTKAIKVCYYISPQVWAWKESRVHAIKKSVDKMLVILPFEQAFYKRHHFPVTYVGHPLTEVVTAALQKPVLPISSKPVIALLPGSRKQEIQTILPIMLTVVPRFPDFQFVVAQAPGQDEATYQSLIADLPVKVVSGQTYDLLKQARAALVTSGTATLETALFGVPQLVCYKGHIVSYWLARKLIRVKYISLVNLILDKKAVPELIQRELTTATLTQHLHQLLSDTEVKEEMQSDYTRLWEMLGAEKSSKRAAEEVFAMIAPTAAPGRKGQDN